MGEFAWLEVRKQMQHRGVGLAPHGSSGFLLPPGLASVALGEDLGAVPSFISTALNVERFRAIVYLSFGM